MLRHGRMALAASFIALAVALGFLLSAVPNVELLTLTVFLAGGVLGSGLGAGVGATAALLFSLLNPLGPPPLPLLLVGQLLGMALAGAVGGLTVPRLAALPVTGRMLLCAGLGFVVTLAYDVLTNLGVAIHLGPIRPTLIGGLAFAAVHMVSNTVVFGVLGPGALRVLDELGQLSRER